MKTYTITVNGKAYAVTVEEGAAADVIIVNYNPLTPMNENNINGHLVFGVTGHDVVTTVANGKVLMKDRRLTEIDEAKVMADCRQAAAELGKRINSRQAQIDGYRSLMLTYITDVDSIFDRTFRQN